MFCLVLIFFFEVIFASLPTFVGEITTMIARIVFTITDEERNAREEIRELRDEQGGLSVTDDFVRFAKLQRKIDKLMTGIKEKDGERKQNIAYLRIGVSAGIHVLHVLILLILMYLLRNDPLMTFPSSWFYPFGKIVALPTGIPGGVGLGCWVLVSNSVIHRVKTLLKV